MQGKRLLCATFIGLAAMMGASPTLADECWATLGPGGCLSVPWGWYIEGNGGYAKFSQASYSTSTSGISWNVDVGYKFMPYFGLEIGYTRYTNSSVKNNVGDSIATAKPSALDLAMRGILPLGSFEPFAKLGVSQISSHIVFDEWNVVSPVSAGVHTYFNVYMAVGAAYYISPNVAGHAEWARAVGNNSTGTYDLWSLGITFIYG